MTLRTSLAPQRHLYIGDVTGLPLDYGMVYFGEPNKDPEYYPINIYYDDGLTIPAMQPVRTKGGFLNAMGDMVEVFADERIYSVKVLDAYGRQVFYEPAMSKLSTDNNLTIQAPFTNSVVRTQSDKNAETVSLLDFGAPYSTDSTLQLQNALNYLNSVGGGVLRIPYHTGVLVVSGSITLYPNITVNCDRNLIIDCTGSQEGFQFELKGTTGSEIALSVNKTSGDTVITTGSAHVLSMGDDVLIVSQRECAHADAGDLWRLGETTANSASPFFAEPLVVGGVNSATEFVSSTPLTFPDYRIDKTLETSSFARASSTIMKMNLLSEFKWFGGVFKKEAGSLFHFMWTKNIEIDIEVRRGYGSGIEVYNRFSLKNKIKAKVWRPADWVLEEDHSAYNSIKDVSSWYTEVDLDEENGSQGLDQTYSTYCGIYPRYKVRHRNSREDGMTTHGCVYGAIVDIYATNALKAAFRNRARFVEGKVFGLNCYWGLRNSAWGVVDSKLEVQFINNQAAAISLASAGVTANTPAIKNSVFTGRITMSPNSTERAIDVGANLIDTALYVDSKLTFKDLYIRSYGGAIRCDTSINGVTLNNVTVEHFGTSSPIWFRMSAGHKISNLEVIFNTGDGTVPAILASTLSGGELPAGYYGAPAYSIDYKSCKVVNGKLITDDDRLVAGKAVFNGTDTAVSLVNINSKTVSPFFKVSLTSGQTTQNRLVLENSIPIGMEIKVLITKSSTGESFGVYTNSGVVNFLDGVNDLGTQFISVTDKKLITVRKIADNEFIVSK